MSDGSTLADEIENVLENISGWDGVIYKYIPNISKLSDIKDLLTDTDGRINAWFIERTNIQTVRRGESANVATGYRIKRHTFIVRGFKSLYDSSGNTSETDFQTLCDSIEEAFASYMSMGISSTTVIVSDMRIDIAYEMLVNSILCHSVTLHLTIDEYLPTGYHL